MFAECQEEVGDHGASARLWHLCVICAGLLRGASVGNWFNGLFSPNQLWLIHHRDLSKHTCTTHLSLRRGQKCVIILCLISKLAWIRTTIPNNLLWLIAVVKNSARVCAFRRMYMYVCMCGVRRGWTGPGRAGEVRVASLVCPRLSQCGVMSALGLFSRQGSY